jgi:alanine racemase
LGVQNALDRASSMYPISEIAGIVGGTYCCGTAKALSVAHLLIDSRQLLDPANTLFFAIRTEKNDGHRFIAPLYQKGVRCFVLCEAEHAAPFAEAHFILVPNVVIALQKLAAYHRARFSPTVVGITGSNGKTIVKEWIFQLLHGDYPCTRSPKSYNSQIGVPLSVWQLKAEHRLAIFEAGISRMDEMAKIAPIIAPDIGILTNIGTAHDEGFADRTAKTKEKIRLFAQARTILYSADDASSAMLIENAYPDKHKATSSLHGQPATLSLKGRGPRSKGQYGTCLEAVYEGRPVRIEIPFTDAASIENAVHCWLLLLLLGHADQTIAERMAKLEPVAMRLELKAGINHCTLVNDSYNSDLTSVAAALNFLAANAQQYPKRSLIISDILQSGMDEPTLYRTVAELSEQSGISRIIGIGESIRIMKNFLNRKIGFQYYKDTNDFLSQLDAGQFSDEAILIKGARQFGFERIAHRLSQKNHKTVLEVSLSALTHNLGFYQNRLREGTRMMAMVKAAAYGSGSLEVAKLLENQAIDWLAVAYADEGVELRKGGILLPIMVLNPEEASFEAILRHELQAEMYQLRLLQRFISFCQGQPVTIHLKLDTGMKRLGFEATDMDSLSELLCDNPQVQVGSVFTHLAASEAVRHDAFTRRQVARFDAMYERLAAVLGYRPLAHVLNSSGILRFPEYHKDMVRLGIGLYGIGAPELRPACTLKATISQIKHLKPGETVGYGRKGKAKRPSRIATVSIGYADGLPRAAGNGRFNLLLHGKAAPTIGNVCMDMCMVDVTDIPEAQEGDEVILFSEGWPIEQLADSLGTIPYELLTGISQRVKRVYVWE